MLLEMRNIRKSFSGVTVLRGVDFSLKAGEIHALVGHNGAGKSTLMKILSGVYLPDMGTISIDGQAVALSTPHQAQQLGVSIIYQEFNLFPNLTVEENVFIGREPNQRGFVRKSELRRATTLLLEQLGVSLSPSATVNSLSVAQQQMVEIAKALSYNAKIVIMDEPTSALTENEVEALFQIIRGLKARGLGVIFISHRLEEVLAICDRITVLRDGQNAGELPVSEATPQKIVQMMVGRPISDLFQKTGSSRMDRVVLEVRNLSRTATKQDASAISLRDVSLRINAGEILGIAGLVGSGRTELARAIFGADRRDRGEIWVDGKPVEIKFPQNAIDCGIGLVPEDRKLQALVLQLAVRENVSLASLDRLSKYGFVRRSAERRMVGGFIDALQIRTPSQDQRVVNLSGGNQQKVVLAKWLALEPKILLVDEPTRGVDIGAKAEVHSLLNQLAQRGVAIMMISSELPEVLGMSDRILVMRAGRIAGELNRSDATQERVMELATGLTEEQPAA